MKYALRPCCNAEELRACVNLQREIWGYAESDAYPVRLFVNLSRIGGHVLGAFTPKGELAGFVAAMPGWRGRQPYLHSLSLGVRVGHENRGLGRALKLAQRRLAIREGIDLIEWTFDPLRAKNAFLNLVRLGAIVRRYVPDYYGPVESRLQLNLPSDRLIAEWHLRSARVKRALAGKSPRASRKPPVGMIDLPTNLDSLAADDPACAYAWQAIVREYLRSLFRRGLAITGFERGEKTSRYLLDRL